MRKLWKTLSQRWCQHISHNASSIAANNNVKGHDDFDEGFEPDYSMGSDDNEMSWVCSEPMVHKEWFWLRMSHDNVHVLEIENKVEVCLL